MEKSKHRRNFARNKFSMKKRHNAHQKKAMKDSLAHHIIGVFQTVLAGKGEAPQITN